MGLNDEEKILYLRRSYSAVDGLWFMMVEEESEFEKALEIDNKIWAVMPKIQARFLKKALRVDRGLDALITCFSDKLLLDGFQFETERDETSFTIKIRNCPWHETMVKSGREQWSLTIGNTICSTEYAGWIKEFGPGITYEMSGRICAGDKGCEIRFTQS